jgi:GNAT superfamily N-acetyltransferase
VSYTIRQATLDDLPILSAHRRQMFIDMDQEGSADLTIHDAGYADWLKRKLPAGEYVGWLAENEAGEVVAGAGIWIMDWPPHPLDQTARRCTVMNVYTRPDARRQGLARRLMGVLLAWCKENGVRLVLLHPSDEGKALYESLGFEYSGDMVLHLK